MCTPSLAIDAIIEVGQGEEVKIVLVKRRDPPKDIFGTFLKSCKLSVILYTQPYFY